jgi:hypothetical protein
MKKVFRRLATGMIFLLLSACALQTNGPVKLSDKVKVTRLLVLSFRDMSAIYGKSHSALCPLCGQVFLTGEVQKNAVDFLSNNLKSLLKSRTTFTIITDTRSDLFLSDLSAGATEKKSDRMLLMEAGRRADADAVLVGYIYRFRQRVGTSYASESPASVAFALHLINIPDGRSLWAGKIDETQHSLSHNLLEIGSFFRRGAKWITSEDMALSGLEKILKTFPNP